MWLHGDGTLGFTSIQIPSETGSGLLTLRVDAKKTSSISGSFRLTISKLIAGYLLLNNGTTGK